MKYADFGYVIQPGDVIEANFLGTRRHEVRRVTKTMAFVRWNDVAEGKFPRVFDLHFSVIPRPRYNTITYRVLIKE